MDQFASHVVRALFLLLCPQLFQSDVPHKSQASVRSRKSVSWKARQGPLKSIFGDESNQGQSQTSKGSWQPPEFQEVARKVLTTLRTALDANEVRSLAGNKVACPVLQVRRDLVHLSLLTGYSIDGTRDRGRSRSLGRARFPHGSCLGRLDIRVSYAIVSRRWPGSNSNYADNDSPSTPEASDYIATLLRDSTSSHLLETLVLRCPESVFGILWTTYLERSLRKLAMHPVANFVVAKALERANAEQLSYALNELRDSLGKLRRMFASHILSCRCSSLFRNSDRNFTCLDRACGCLERPRG
jgi:nucleolar protein 9